MSERIQAEELQALQDTIYAIGGKWKVPIINSICNGNYRFREIQRSIPKLTTRMLSKELKDMEMNKLVTRIVYDESASLVEYRLTEYCNTYSHIIEEMIKWGKAHRKYVIEKPKIKV